MSITDLSLHTEIVTDRDQWNRFVEGCPTGNITQTFEWGDLGGTLGAETLRLGALEGDELRASMLVVVERAPVLRRPYLYAPRGPVVADPAAPALAALIGRADEEARRRGAFLLKVEPNVPDGDGSWAAALRALGFRCNPYATHPRRSWVLDITPTEEALLGGMKEKWRYNIRLAGRRGVRVREASAPEDLEAFYHIYRETAARDGIFIHSQQHYADFVRLYGARDAAVLLLAEYEGRPIAGLIAARCGPVATYMFGASSNHERNRMPNHLLQWTAIRWAKARGCALYDFRAVAEVLEPGEDMYSLYTYKQGFGGRSVLTLETHDKPYSPPVYWAYTRSLAAKRALDRRRHERASRPREAPPRSPEKPAGAVEGKAEGRAEGRAEGGT